MHIHTCIYVYTHTYMYICIHIYTYIYSLIHIYIYICSFVYFGCTGSSLWQVSSLLQCIGPLHRKADSQPVDHQRSLLYLLSFFIFLIICWDIVDEHGCVSFRCAGKWFSYTCTFIHFLFQILLPFSLLQNTEPRSLCYTGDPCWLSF